jgi:NTP pyrophosphatase (non-canonical NTP hydrolase)
LRVIGIGAGGVPKDLKAGERIYCAPGVLQALPGLRMAREGYPPSGGQNAVLLLFGGPEASDPWLGRALQEGASVAWGAPLTLTLGLASDTVSRWAGDRRPWPAAQGVLLYGPTEDELPSPLEEAAPGVLWEGEERAEGDVLELSRRRSSRRFLYVPPLGGAAALRFVGAQAVMARLRAPDGCPWDRQQTHRSLLPYLLEEAAEAYDALQDGNVHESVEELGDLFLQVLFHAELGQEEGMYDAGVIAEALRRKLRRRHPHVFGDEHYASAEEFLPRWEELKAAEGLRRDSALSGIPRSLSSLAALQKAVNRLLRIGVTDIAEGGLGADLVERIARGEDLEAAVRAEFQRIRSTCAGAEAILGRKLSEATRIDVQTAWNKAKMA